MKKEIPKDKSSGIWLGYRDSNPNIQSQSLLCYRYTISHCCVCSLEQIYYTTTDFICQAFFEKFSGILDFWQSISGML